MLKILKAINNQFWIKVVAVVVVGLIAQMVSILNCSMVAFWLRNGELRRECKDSFSSMRRGVSVVSYRRIDRNSVKMCQGMLGPFCQNKIVQLPSIASLIKYVIQTSDNQMMQNSQDLPRV